MEFKEIKQLNITLLFSEPLNHLLITFNDLLDLFKVGDERLDQHSFIEAPGLKVLIFPNRQREIVFEANRVLINDKSKKEPQNSEVVEDLKKILQKNKMVDRNKIIAYGFNYDIVGTSEKEKVEDFISSKIIDATKNIKSAGVNLVFEKDTSRQTLQIRPLPMANQYLINLNVHYQQPLGELTAIKQKLNDDLTNLLNLIKKI
jgi:hypothetical protein